MRAIQITDTGGPEVLRLVELPDPSPGPGQLLVEELEQVQPQRTVPEHLAHGCPLASSATRPDTERPRTRPLPSPTRPDNRWMARARSVLPVPDSPVINTGESVVATRSRSVSTACIGAYWVITSGVASTRESRAMA